MASEASASRIKSALKLIIFVGWVAVVLSYATTLFSHGAATATHSLDDSSLQQPRQLRSQLGANQTSIDADEHKRRLFEIQLERTMYKLPHALEHNLLDWENYPTGGIKKDPHELPVFWHVLKSGGTTVKLMYALCYHLVEACETGILIDVDGQDQEQQIQEQQIQEQQIQEQQQQEQQQQQPQLIDIDGNNQEQQQLAQNVVYYNQEQQQPQLAQTLDAEQQNNHPQPWEWMQQQEGNNQQQQQPPQTSDMRQEDGNPQPWEWMQQQQQQPALNGEQQQQPELNGEQQQQPELNGEQQQQQYELNGEQQQQPELNGEQQQQQPELDGEQQQQQEQPELNGEHHHQQQQQEQEQPEVDGEQQQQEEQEQPELNGEQQEQSEVDGEQQQQEQPELNGDNAQRRLEEAGSNGDLKVVISDDGRKYVDVDVTTAGGILKAAERGFATSSLADVVFTPLLIESAESLLDGAHNYHKGRMFAVFRHPVERVISIFYYLQHATWEPTYNPEFAQWTIDDYARSELAESNWMTRSLIGKMTGPMAPDDILIAQEVLRRKCLVGLMENMEESIHRFHAYFGFGDDYALTCSLDNFARRGSGQNSHSHPTLDPQSETWQILERKNGLDMRLYAYVQDLFEEQGNWLRKYQMIL